MKSVLNSRWLYALLGIFVGYCAISSGEFREGAGLVLAFLSLAALVLAAVLGVLSTLVRGTFAVVASRIALFCLSFCVSTFVFDYLKS